MGAFEGRVAIVTGGASGIGRALCTALGRRGAHVVVADLDEAGAQATAASISDAGGRARAERLDVTDAGAVRALVEETARREGSLDLFVNNAGIMIGGEIRDMSAEHWRRIVDVNLWGVVNGVCAAYPIMIRQGSGRIVNVASGAGLVPNPLSAAYAMTKHAVVGLSLSLRPEAAGLGVGVSVVCPGYVDTAIFDSGVSLAGPSLREQVSRGPLRHYPAAKAANTILRGVARDRAVIVFPFHMHAMLWASRLAPWIVRRGFSVAIERYRREVRTEPPARG